MGSVLQQNNTLILISSEFLIFQVSIQQTEFRYLHSGSFYHKNTQQNNNWSHFLSLQLTGCDKRTYCFLKHASFCSISDHTFYYLTVLEACLKPKLLLNYIQIIILCVQVHYSQVSISQYRCDKLKKLKLRYFHYL